MAEIQTIDLTLQEIYNSVKSDNSAGYDAFRKKLHRLAEGNQAALKRAQRKLGIAIPSASQKRFVGYDGEGWQNKYVLLANSLGEYISNPDGLSTTECIEFLTRVYEFPPIRVFYAFSYDVNMIVKDFTDEQITDLLAGRVVEFEGHHLSYIPAKIFTVDGFKYYDVFSFYARSFEKAVALQLPEIEVSPILKKGKAARGSFETWDMDELIEYNAEELRLLVLLCNKLNDSLQKIDVNLREWYGPGAIAKVWFRQHGVQRKETYDPKVIWALVSAYYGGRFEQIKLGKFNTTYEYDIRSAYPSVITTMPHFTSWRRVTDKHYDKNNPYSVWHISFDSRPYMMDLANGIASRAYLPLPMRNGNGRISFPVVGRGWYWQREVQNLLDFFPKSKVRILEGYIATTEGQPFTWVADLYDFRSRLKKEGDLAEYAIKVGLNSLYGKTAQKVGSNKYFSLAWAGYITSTVRAKIARAGYENHAPSVIGFATDALFTTKPFKNLDIGEGLGQWEESRFDSGLFLQSGVYRLQKEGQESVDRYRGSPLRHGIDDAIEQIKKNPTKYSAIKQTRFISNLLAIKAPNAYGSFRRQFIQVNHALQFDAPYKRHYMFPIVGAEVGEAGLATHIIRDYSVILKGPVDSRPKVFMDDEHWMLWNDYMTGKIGIHNIESFPQFKRDAVMQRLIDDSIISARDDFEIKDVSELEGMPIVDDETF